MTNREHGGKACYKLRMGDPENIPFCLMVAISRTGSARLLMISILKLLTA